ncbi:hypothetical protein LTR60_002399, partial [Cryomyces antarcticus]
RGLRREPERLLSGNIDEFVRHRILFQTASPFDDGFGLGGFFEAAEDDCRVANPFDDGFELDVFFDKAEEEYYSANLSEWSSNLGVLFDNIDLA